MRTQSTFVVIMTAILLTCTGCGGDGVRITDVSGTVNFAGNPIPFGEIEFIPNAVLNHKGPSGSAEIVDGKFDTSDGGRGVVVGPHQLRITAYKSRPTGNEDETKTSEQEPPVFVGYVMDMDIDGGAIVVDVPKEAEGFNSMAPETTRRRTSDP